MSVALVAVENALYDFDKLFSYRIKPAVLGKVMPGVRVTVPFGKGNRKCQGMVFEIIDEKDETGLKYISDVLDDLPVVTTEQLKMAAFIKEMTFCTFYEGVKPMLPAGISYTIVKKYAFGGDEGENVPDTLTPEEKSVVDFLKEKCEFVEEGKIRKALSLKDPDIFQSLISKKAIVKISDSEKILGEKTERLYSLTGLDENEEKPFTKKQEAVLTFLKDAVSANMAEILSFCPVSAAVVKNLENKGYIKSVERVIAAPSQGNEGKKEEIVLSPEQQTAYESIKADIDKNEYSVSLLFGVTGSGKTAVYVKAIDYTLSLNKKVIVLVPEIGLTPQTMRIFTARYGDRVSVLHSALSMRERAEEWKKLKDGRCDIAVGTRSAIFAPVENIGLIIIDEEQEHTYKSEQTPRYKSLDVAKFRCHSNNAVLLLASATPSIESYAAAESGRYKLLELKSRYGSSVLPTVEVVDMRRAEKTKESGEISVTLKNEIENCLKEKKQAVILINRRGYNTFATCAKCGGVVSCPNCSISLTYHSYTKSLKCHYCGYTLPFTAICPECGEEGLSYRGYGTQKIEEKIGEIFPTAKILRFDADTTAAKDSHRDLLSAFAKGEYDIMLGTQMVAKGLDFPSVTLVGVINADMQLYSDDFRALEKTFSLLTQVVGRSGRGQSPGKAIIQTLTPENEIIALAARQDYKKYFETEYQLRRSMIYPPFCDICVIGFVGEDSQRVQMVSRLTLDKIKALIKTEFTNEKVIILGPAPAAVVKVNNKYRYRIIMKCKNSAGLRLLIKKILTTHSDKTVAVYADINPDVII